MDYICDLINKFLDGELSAAKVELEIKDKNLYNIFNNSIDYNLITQPLNKKYYDITGKGIVFDLTKAYPPRIDCLICLLKAIENKKDVEFYYSEYWKKNIPETVFISDFPKDILF